MIDPSTAFTSPGKQADWMKGDGQASAVDTSDVETTASTPARAGQAGFGGSEARCSRARSAASSQPAGARRCDREAGCKTHRGRRCRRCRRSRRPAAAGRAETITQPRGRAYLFRGVAGLIYSRGIDTLAARIKRTGIPASVGTYLLWRPTADEAIRDYRRDPQPITLIGHSMGGDCVLDFAEMLNEAGIPVSLLVTYDPDPHRRRRAAQCRALHQHLPILEFHGRRQCRAGLALPRPLRELQPQGPHRDRSHQYRKGRPDSGAIGEPRSPQLAANAGRCRRRSGADPSGGSGRRRHRTVGFRYCRSRPMPATL